MSYHESMRIVCPSCNAAYEVPDGQLREGRMVRCARCGTEWAPIAAPVASEPKPVDELEVERDELAAAAAHDGREMALEEAIASPASPAAPAPAAPAPVQAPPSGRRFSLMAAWALSVIAVAAAGAGLVIGRDRVMAAWAPSIRAYAALGLAGR